MRQQQVMMVIDIQSHLHPFYKQKPTQLLPREIKDQDWKKQLQVTF